MVALLVPGAILFVGIFLVMWSQASTSATRPHAEASTLTNLLTVPLRAIMQAFERLTRATISHFAASHLIPLVRWFSAANALVVDTSDTYASTMEETATSVERLRHHVIPREAKKAAAPAKAEARSAHRAADRADAHATATSKSLTTYRTHTNTTLRHHTHALDVTLPRSIGGIRTREQELARDQAKLRERTKSLENGAVKTFEWIRAHPLSGVTAVFAGAVAIALARLGFGMFRCRSWQRLGRRLTCGMGSLLEDLLFGAFTALAATDLCLFADGMDTLARQLQPLFLKLVDVEDALVGCHGATKPDALSLPRLYLPPVPDPLPLG